MTDAPATRTSPPWHLWVVGVLSLLWNAFGATDFVMTMLNRDAWFDMMTSVGPELWQAAGAAVLVELPLAALLMSGAFRAIKLASALLWLAEPSTPMWRIPLPAERARR